MPSKPLLVTGAAGQLGRQVVEALLEAGAGPVIAATRDPAKLADLAPRGVELRRADFDDAASLAAAFAGVGRILLVSTDALAEPGRRLGQHRAAIDAAVKAGVEHVVYTSAPAARPQDGGGLLDDHFWTEAALFAAPLDWTILRDNLYADLLPLSLLHAIATGTLYSATAGRGRAYVTRADCARAAAAALAGSKGRAILDVGGPAAVTQEEVADIVSGIVGKPIRHVAVSGADLAAGLAGAGLPPFLVKALVDFDLDAAKGYHAVVTGAVEDLTGKKPQSLAAFLESQAARLRA